MGALGMAWRGLRARGVASTLTGASVALGVALAVAVFVLERAARAAFEGTATGVEVLVAGTKGSRLDAVLGTLFHVGRAPGRLPLAFAERLAADPRVEYAIPVAVGDSFRGAPIVGTTEEFFERFRPRPGLAFEIEGEWRGGGRAAVAGAEAARRTGLRVGDVFAPSHSGLAEDPTHRDEPFTVTGVARATGTAHDRAIYVDLADFLHLRGHSGMARDGEDEAAVSAVLVKTRAGSPLVLEPFLREIDDSREAQAVRPAQVVAELFDLVGSAQRVLGWVAWLVVAVACAAVAVSLYAATAARRGEIAVLRALGARRRTVFFVVQMEAALVCALGGLGGLLLGRAGAMLAAPFVEARAGVRLDVWGGAGAEAWLLPLVTALGSLAGLLPAARAYRVEVREHLG
jgi:putative ABC transport system permease protein